MSQEKTKEVVAKLIKAMDVNDADKIRTSFHKDARQAYGNGDWKSSKDFFNWLESDIIERKGHVEDARYEIYGNEVVVKGQYSSQGYTNKANFLFTVQDDAIKSWQMRY